MTLLQIVRAELYSIMHWDLQACPGCGELTEFVTCEDCDRMSSVCPNCGDAFDATDGATICYRCEDDLIEGDYE